MFLFCVWSCNNDDDQDDSVSQCDYNVIIDGDQYAEASPNDYDIANAEIIDDCLKITIRSGGCDGESWEVMLVSDYPLAFGDSFGANVGLKLTNTEDCEAYITKSFSFDLSVIHNNNTDGVITLDGWDGTLQISN